MKRIMEIKDERDIWRIIKKEKGIRAERCDEMRMEEWETLENC